MSRYEGVDFYKMEQHLNEEEIMVRDLVRDWVDEKVSTEKFKDILQFLLKQKFIDIEPSNYITPEFIPSPTDKQILLTYFPTDLETEDFAPYTWKYFDSSKCSDLKIIFPYCGHIAK